MFNLRYLTPTDEIVEKKEILDETETTEKTEDKCDDEEEFRTVKSDKKESEEDVKTNSSSNDVIVNESNSDNELIKNNSEAVPIVENSAVSVELEPSKNESSLGEATVQSSDNDSKLADGAETEVPQVENISTISQYCDPSHNTTNTAVTTDVVVNVEEKSSNNQTESPQTVVDGIKRRVSLPTCHTETQNGDFNRASGAASPQKRPRSASTSTQVDPQLFGESFFFDLVLSVYRPFYNL